MSNTFKVRLKCPYGDQDGWLALRDRDETLDQILETPWAFECPVHGLQREFPLEGRAVGVSSPKRQRRPSTVTGRVAAQQRASRRISLRATVLVYGSARGQEFVEETSTLLVNAGGALLALSTKVRLGQTIFVASRETKEQQECRVAYVGPELDGKTAVGIGFKSPTFAFWRLDSVESPPPRPFHRKPRKRFSESMVRTPARKFEGKRNSRSREPKTAQIILVLAASLVIGAIAPLGLTLARRAWPQIPLPVFSELGAVQKSNRPSTAGGLAPDSLGLMSNSPTPTQAGLPQSTEPGMALKPGQSGQPNVASGALKLTELPGPWSSKTFLYRRSEHKESVPAMVIRMPGSSPGEPISYWAFSLATPVTHCQLEYITDLRKLLAEYRFRAVHPMVGDPCSRSVFDPLKMADLANGNWARGAVVQGFALRPPLGIELRIKNDRLVLGNMEAEF